MEPALLVITSFNEWASALDHIITHGVEVKDETLATDVIKRVGIQGSYIADAHTLRHMRETYWKSTIFNYEGFDWWLARGGRDAYALTHEKVNRILARHYPPQVVVAEEVKRSLDALIADAMAHPERFAGERYQYMADKGRP